MDAQAGAAPLLAAAARLGPERLRPLHDGQPVPLARVPPMVLHLAVVGAGG